MFARDDGHGVKVSLNVWTGEDEEIINYTKE